MSAQPQNTPNTDVELFDPSAYGVAEVNDHLAESDPDEVARILALESEAEKPRKGIVEGPHATVPEEATPEELLGDADPYEYVRAKDAQGNEYSTTRIAALNARSTVLDHKSATDAFGQLIRTKTVLDLRAETTDTTTATSEEN